MVVVLIAVGLTVAACAPSSIPPSSDANDVSSENANNASSENAATSADEPSNTTAAPAPSASKPTEKELWKKFLKNDFTVIAGTWEDGTGIRLVIRPDGSMGKEQTLSNGMTGYSAIFSPRMNKDERMFAREGVYFASMGTKLTDKKDIERQGSEYLPSVGVIFFPSGQEIIVSDRPGNAGNPVKIKTDETKIRMILTQTELDGWLPENQDRIFYRVSTDTTFK